MLGLLYRLKTQGSERGAYFRATLAFGVFKRTAHHPHDKMSLDCRILDGIIEASNTMNSPYDIVFEVYQYSSKSIESLGKVCKYGVMVIQYEDWIFGVGVAAVFYEKQSSNVRLTVWRYSAANRPYATNTRRFVQRK